MRRRKTTKRRIYEANDIEQWYSGGITRTLPIQRTNVYHVETVNQILRSK